MHSGNSIIKAREGYFLVGLHRLVDNVKKLKLLHLRFHSYLDTFYHHMALQTLTDTAYTNTVAYLVGS